MAGPPTKKRRRTIIDSEDEENEPIESHSNSSKAPPTRRTSTRTSSSSKAASHKASTKATTKQPAKVPPRQSPVKSQSNKLTGKYSLLHSFFGVPPEGDRTANEVAEDAIEEVSDDDLIPTKPRVKVLKDSSLQPHLVVSKPGLSNVKSASTTKPLSNGKVSTPVAKKIEDSRTWPEKFEPQSIAELAIHKTKVKEVQSWLENVLNRSTQQRMLVLKGPAGAGKTATVTAIAKEFGVEILEWRNPQTTASGGAYGEDSAFTAGLSGMFEEFMGRAGTFESLELAPSTGPGHGKSPAASSKITTNLEDGKPKFIVIEDFPNTLFTSSTIPLQAFRHSIKSFLAIPSPPLEAPPFPPLILIITETPSITGPQSFTAHRLLSPEILHHPLVREINFNKIAPTYMFRALSAIVAKEARQSSRKFGPSKAVLDALSISGDIRSAIMGLEFLAMNGDMPDTGFQERISTSKRRGKRPDDQPLTAKERAMIRSVTNRESTYGIFHSIGKVLYNKRYGDDPEDDYHAPPIRPPLSTLPYHARAVRTDLDTLIDDTGTDPQTFIQGLHENYLLSCNPGGVARLPTSDEDVVDCYNGCLDYLSDSDILGSRQWNGYNNSDDNNCNIRADEISFHTAVRGIMLSLPSPVKRFLEPKGGANKMNYPTSARLWKQKQEVAETVDWFVVKNRAISPCTGGVNEALLERMPYMALIERRRDWARRQQGAFKRGIPAMQSEWDLPTKVAIEKATVFKGIGRPSDEPVSDAEEEGEPRKWKKKEEADVEISIGEKLVLSDDDIEDF
ncbi:Rad17 cell cycle checkpoint protein-domain-containing protein [Pyronema omphalodes]|nr:Rad17 cell cycle checkpoint protein-domain-containing protein [Pyronema omphalodes]